MAKNAQDFGLARGLGVSAGLHALPVALWLGLAASWFATPPAPRISTLQIDLLGMLDTRQQEERHAARAPEPPPPAPTPPKPTPRVEKPKAKKPERPNKRSVKVRAPTPEPPAPEMAPMPAPPMPEMPSAPGGDLEDQLARTISQQELEATQMRKYAAEVARTVRAFLAYPAKARTKGWTGVTRIGFEVDESGQLRSGSVSVLKSSGYPELDEAALDALRLAGALPRPPKHIRVTIDLDFYQMAK